MEVASSTVGYDPAAETAAAYRRAALEHHRRVVRSDLERSPDRRAIDDGLGTSDRPVSAVVVRAAAADGRPRPDDAVVGDLTGHIRKLVREPLGVHRFGERHLVLVAGDRTAAEAVAARLRSELGGAGATTGAPAERRADERSDEPARLVLGVGVAAVADDDPTLAVQRADLSARRELDAALSGR